MDKTFGKYLIRTTVVSSGFNGEKSTAYWEVFDPDVPPEKNPIAEGVSVEMSSFEQAADAGHGEAVIWLEKREGRGKVEIYRDHD